MNRLIFATVLVISSLHFSAATQAGGRRFRLFQPARQAERHAQRRAATRVPVRRTRPATLPLSDYRDHQGAYPKYYGGFHVRQLQNIGIPSSDIGLRGNGLTWGPW